MKVIGVKIINDIEVPMIVECMSMEISGSSGFGDKFNPDHCRVYMRSAHPTVSFFIIKKERYDKSPNIRPYKWLNIKEAKEIMNCAMESDVVDLSKLGDYHICSDKHTQSVIIMNDINEFTDEEIPIMVKHVKDSGN